MASLEELIEDIDNDIANQEAQLEQLRNTKADLIDTYDELYDRMIIPTVALVDQFIEDKMAELRITDPVGQWRIVKQTDYNRDLPEYKNNPGLPALNQYAVSSLGNIPEEHFDRFGTVSSGSSSWRIEEDINFGMVGPPADWVLRYDYNNVLLDNETEVIEANEEYFYAYDLIAQRPVVFDGTYGTVEKINNISRAISILTFDLEKLVDTKTSVERTIENEGV